MTKEIKITYMEKEGTHYLHALMERPPGWIHPKPDVELGESTGSHLAICIRGIDKVEIFTNLGKSLDKFGLLE